VGDGRRTPCLEIGKKKDEIRLELAMRVTHDAINEDANETALPYK
jgi:hypothetical protein